MEPSKPLRLVEITPAELNRRLSAGDRPLLLDVREPWEWRMHRIPGATHVPLGQLRARLGELDPARETICVCEHGVRSAEAALFLTWLGFQDAKSLAGGMSVWPGPRESG